MPSCFWRVGLGAHQDEHHLRHVGGAGPDLLAVDDEVVAVLDRAWSGGSRDRCRRRARSSPGTRLISPRIVGPIQRCFCSSVPCASSVGTSIEGPWAIGRAVRPPALNSSSMMTVSRMSGSAPKPPYSAGSCAPSSRARSAARATRCARSCPARPCRCGPSACASSRKSRTSARRASYRASISRSIVVVLSRG